MRNCGLSSSYTIHFINLVLSIDHDTARFRQHCHKSNAYDHTTAKDRYVVYDVWRRFY